MATAYIESTIPSDYTARNARSILQASRHLATREWWDEGCSGFDLVTSTETLNEAGEGDLITMALVGVSYAGIGGLSGTRLQVKPQAANKTSSYREQDIVLPIDSQIKVTPMVQKKANSASRVG